jgi:tetratricopeptide (TPR) repeat protein
VNRTFGAGLETVTVMFTDMVASTELRTRLGDAAADEVMREHDALLDSAVVAAAGAVVKHLGDGVLAVFHSASAAVEAAVLLQRRAVRLRRRDPQRGFALRVGISAGDVQLSDDDVSGSPVVEASRLCDQAGADEILLSDVVRVLVGSRRGCPLEERPTLDPAFPGAHALQWHLERELADHGVVLPAPLVRARVHDYVGHHEVRRLLRDRLELARGGVGGAALLAGEPGIGKTRTCAELATRAADLGVLVLYGRCDEMLGAPYQPFVEALDGYARQSAAPRLGRLSRELSRLVPELPELVPGTGSPLASDPRTEEYRLHDAVAAWVVDCAQEHGLLLVLDDLHWADATTLALLLHVVRAVELAGAPVLVLGAYRDTEARAAARLDAVLADLRRLPGSVRVPLGGLAEPDVHALVAARAGHALDDEQAALASRVWSECEGNPLFVHELLRHMLETGQIREVGGRWHLVADVEVPESVREVVARRLEVLPPGGTEVLRTAAVLGRTFTLGLLSLVAARPEDEVLAALETAVHARLVQETGPATFKFSHALVRTTLYDGQSLTTRSRTHRRVVEALRPGADVALLAHHALRSGPQGPEVLEAAQWAVAAGENALAARALADAEQRLRAALGFLRDVPDGAALTARALVALGEAQRDQGDAGFRETLAEGFALADSAGDTSLVVRAALADDRGTTLVAAPDPERVSRVERALELVGPDPGEARTLLLARLVGEVTFAGDPVRRRRLALEAETTAQRLADPRTAARVLVRTGMAAHMLGGGRAALARAERNCRLADQVGDPALRVTALSWLSASQVVEGRLEQAEETSALLQEVAAEASPSMRWFARMLQVRFLAVRGEFAAAQKENDACLDLALELREPDAEAVWGALAATIALNAGAAAQFADPAAAFAARFPTVPNWQAGLAQCLAEAGRHDEARQAVTATGPDLPALMEEPFAYQVGWSLASVAAQLDDPVLAHRVQQVLAPHRGRWSHLYLGVLGPVRWALGRCGQATGALDRAVEDLSGALEETRRVRADALSGLIALDLAHTFAARSGRSDRSAALDLLAEVTDGDVRHLHARAHELRERLAS